MLKYLLGEFCYPNGHTRLEFELVRTQSNFRIPNNLIKKNYYCNACHRKEQTNKNNKAAAKRSCSVLLTVHIN